MLIFAIFALVFLTFRAVSGGERCLFYPTLRYDFDPISAAIYAAICSLPTIFEIKESVKWHCWNAKN